MVGVREHVPWMLPHSEPELDPIEMPLGVGLQRPFDAEGVTHASPGQRSLCI
jgi:hypothetical protein